MARIIKATSEEKKGYKGLYSLFGFIEVDGQRCAVEYLGEGPGEPNYEVMAPDGMIFIPDGTHTLLCTTQADARSRASGNVLKKDRGDSL